MIIIYVDSYNTAAEVCKFIQDSLNAYGCVSLGDILYVTEYPHIPWTYHNILFYREAELTSIMPIYSYRSKGYKLIIPYNSYTMTFDCTNKNDSATKHSAFIPKCTPKPTNYLPEIKNVKFDGPATIVFWADGTKTVVKCQDGDDYSEEAGLAMCIVKKAFGNTSKYYDVFKKWCNNHVLKTFNEII